MTYATSNNPSNNRKIYQMPEPVQYNVPQPVVIIEEFMRNVNPPHQPENIVAERIDATIRKARREYLWNFCVCGKCVEISEKELELLFKVGYDESNSEWVKFLDDTRAKGRCLCVSCRKLCSGKTKRKVQTTCVNASAQNA